MSVNLTLAFEVVAFLLFIYLMKRFAWKPIVNALEGRQKTIAESIAAAERGRREMEEAEKRAEQVIAEARRRANEIIDGSNKRAAEIVEEARGAAEAERTREVERAKAEIDQSTRQAREALRGQFARIAAEAAGRILQREIDPKRHQSLIEEVAKGFVNG